MKIDAKNVYIYFGFYSEYKIVLRVKDDGLGMYSHELEEAMRIGAESTYEKGDYHTLKRE